MLLTLLATVFRMIIIPAQFQDCSFTGSREELEKYCNSIQEYFNTEYRNSKTFEFTLAPTVTLQYGHAYYCANYSDRKDILIHEAVREACRKALSIGDCNSCDNDGDGIIDNVMIITSGLSENGKGGGSDWPWPQRAFLEGNGGMLQIADKRVNSYVVIPETGPDGSRLHTGIACHEFAHVLGLQDFYDTDGDGSGGLAPGLWKSSLMDEGCIYASEPPRLNALEMELLGIGEGEELSAGMHILEPLERSAHYYKISSEGELFLIECRSGSPGGLVIYHLDRSQADAGYSDYYKKTLSAAQRWEYNQVNCRPDRMCARVITTDGAEGMYFPSNGKNSIGSGTLPQLRFSSGSYPLLSLTNIRLLDDGRVSFNALAPFSISSSEIFQYAATICWKADLDSHDIAGFTLEWEGPEGRNSVQLEPQSSGWTISGLAPGTKYTYTLSALSLEGDRFTIGDKFCTKGYIPGTHPYIYFGQALRGNDGSFSKDGRIPLQVFNAPDTERIEWYFNGKAISEGPDGYFTLPGSGTLKARIHSADGSINTIIKEILIK